MDTENGSGFPLHRSADNNAMNRSRENLPDTISADWHSPIISATIYLRVARRGSIIAAVIRLNDRKYMGSNLSKGDLVAVIDGYFQNLSLIHISEPTRPY